MDSVRVLLLLLLCSVSGAELQENEIQEHGEAGAESVQVAELPRPSNLRAVLRDMSANLAENKLMIQEQAEKLSKYEVRVEQLEALNQEQAAKLAEDEVGLQKLQTFNQVGQVAFSASLLASGYGYTGPFSSHTTLAFRHVLTNIGNAYNSQTGMFTAPVRGAYHFEFYAYVGGGSPGTVVVLVKNGEHVFIAKEEQSSDEGTTANAAIVVLEAGDVVFLRLWGGFRIWDSYNHHSTFSGHLLFPLF